MYDSLSIDYDRFVHWEERLATELPFIEQQLATVDRLVNKPLHVLDAACGTGMHAVALAQRGYQMAGADLSPAMIEQARANAIAAGVTVDFKPAGFGQLQQAFVQDIPFDALLCLGNSLPHLLSSKDLRAALVDFAACLRPGGYLLIQNRNFEPVLANHERWMEPQSHREGQHEWLFLRFYDFEPDGLITFNMVSLQREGQSPWSQRVLTTHLRPLMQEELETMAQDAGFTDMAWYGNLAGAPYDPQTSGNLVLSARLA